MKNIVLPVVGDFTTSDIGRFRSLEGVEKVLRISKPYYLVTKDYRKKSVVELGENISIGDSFSFIAGPCSVESEESLEKIASHLSALGVKILRGGTFKMRTSPYSFQGLGEDGLKILRRIGDKYGMKVVSEITDIRDISIFAEYVDMIQIGARNMSNFSMLKEIGKQKKPIMLKRSPSATIDEFLSSAEYILSEGNENVVLCERGSVSIDANTRNSINIATIPILKAATHLPVIIDPSHGVGVARFIPQVAAAAPVLGADGIMIETHFSPSDALSDGFQSLTLESFTSIYKKVTELTQFLND